MNDFNGLLNVNIELSSRCNKNCWCCGRRKIDRDYPEIAMNYGDMDYDLAVKISKQLPNNIVVQFHNNGESLLHPRFGDIIKLYKNQIRTMDTNGKLIIKKAKEIINQLDSLTISVIQDDGEVDEQYRLVKEFLSIKGERKPFLIYRGLGDVDMKRWKELDGIVVTRILHDPMGPFNYERQPTIPEIGICLDILSHMSIDRLGNVSPCVRFDPLGKLVVGNANEEKLVDIWNGEKMTRLRKMHIDGKRDKIEFCNECTFWGIPTSRVI